MCTKKLKGVHAMCVTIKDTTSESCVAGIEACVVGCPLSRAESLLTCKANKDYQSASCKKTVLACPSEPLDDREEEEERKEKEKTKQPWTKIVTLSSTLAIGDDPVEISLKASYEHPANIVKLEGSCGDLDADVLCYTDMFGVRGFGIAAFGASATLKVGGNATRFTDVKFGGGVQLGAHTQPFSGHLSGKNLKDMTFLLPSINPARFVDFVKRTAESRGPNWLANLPQPPEGELGLAFTNVVCAGDDTCTVPTWTPCTGCDAKDLKPGITIVASGIGLPSDTVERLGSVGFLQGAAGEIEGNLAVGFNNSNIRNSSVAFAFTGGLYLGGNTTLTHLNAAFDGGANTPELSGELGLQVMLPAPATDFAIDYAKFSYASATKAFEFGASVSLNFEEWSGLPSGTVMFDMYRSPTERRYTVNLPRGITNIPAVDFKAAHVQYRKVQDDATKTWAPAAWAFGMTVQPDITGFPALQVGVTWADSCVAASIGASEEFRIWGVRFQDSQVYVNHCQAASVNSDAGTQFGFSGLVGIDGPLLKSFTLGAVDGALGTVSWRKSLADAMELTLATMPLIWFKIGVAFGSDQSGLEVAIPIDKNKDLMAAILPIALDGAADGAEFRIAIPFTVPVLPEIAIVFPSLAVKSGIHVTWGALEVRVMDLVTWPKIRLAWGFDVQFTDSDGYCCSEVQENGLTVDGKNPVVTFQMSVDAEIPSTGLPRFVFSASMVAMAWLEDFLGIPNFGVKGLALMIGLSPAPPYVNSFGIGSQFAMYQGTPGEVDVNLQGDLGENDSKIVLGATLAAQLDAVDPTNNCMYFSLNQLTMSKVIGYVVGYDVSIPEPLDMTITKMEYGMSTKTTAERCMDVSPVLQQGIMWDLDATWLGFAVIYKMTFFKKEGSLLPAFTLFLEVSNNGFINELMDSIRTKVNGAMDTFVELCDPIPIVNLLCRAASSVVQLLFTVLVDGLFAAFVFYYFKVDVPDLTEIATGGDWPSFALKIQLLGIMIDIEINLGKVLGGISDLLLNALQAAADFFTYLWEGITGWFSNIANSISITVASCRTLTCGIETYNSCESMACPCKSCRNEVFGCDQHRQCQTYGCGCKKCRDPSFGCAKYKNCQTYGCGCNKCRDPYFGCAKHKYCKTTSCGCASCRGTHCNCPYGYDWLGYCKGQHDVCKDSYHFGDLYSCYRCGGTWCRHYDCGCELNAVGQDEASALYPCTLCGAKVCRHANCGCELHAEEQDTVGLGLFPCSTCGAHTCAHENCGCKQPSFAQDGYYGGDVSSCPRCGFTSCPALLCGVKEYYECANPICGVSFSISDRRLRRRLLGGEVAPETVPQQAPSTLRRVRLLG